MQYYKLFYLAHIYSRTKTKQKFFYLLTVPSFFFVGGGRTFALSLSPCVTSLALRLQQQHKNKKKDNKKQKKLVLCV